MNVKRPTGRENETLTHAQFRKQRIQELFGGNAAAENEFRRLRRGRHYRAAERVVKLLAEGHPKTAAYWTWRAQNFRDLGREDRARECEDIRNNM